jgi:hypothetical protein
MIMDLLDNTRGDYRFLTGIPPYSSGVIPMDGHEVVHLTLQKPLPWQAGFALIERHLAAAGRPKQALCAIALRCPKPMSFDGFADFNADYRAILEDWDLLVDGHNPVARTNVAPIVASPAETVLYAFAYTAPGKPGTFVVAGAGDLDDQGLVNRGIVRAGETSAGALREKAQTVMARMDDRVRALGVSWDMATRVNVFTMHPLHDYLGDVILQPMGASAIHGIHWTLAQPPISGLAFEMDLRATRQDGFI